MLHVSPMTSSPFRCRYSPSKDVVDPEDSPTSLGSTVKDLLTANDALDEKVPREHDGPCGTACSFLVMLSDLLTAFVPASWGTRKNAVEDTDHTSVLSDAAVISTPTEGPSPSIMIQQPTAAQQAVQNMISKLLLVDTDRSPPKMSVPRRLLLTIFHPQTQLTAEAKAFHESTLLLRGILSAYMVSMIVIGQTTPPGYRCFLEVDGSFSDNSLNILVGGLVDCILRYQETTMRRLQVSFDDVKREVLRLLVEYTEDVVLGMPLPSSLCTPPLFLDEIIPTLVPTFACTGCMQADVPINHSCPCVYGSLVFHPVKFALECEEDYFASCPFCQPGVYEYLDDLFEHWATGCIGLGRLVPKPSLLVCDSVVVVTPFCRLGEPAPLLCRKCRSCVAPHRVAAHAAVCETVPSIFETTTSDDSSTAESYYSVHDDSSSSNVSCSTASSSQE